MPTNQHRALTSLVQKLVRDGKYLSIEVHDERPDAFSDGEPVTTAAQLDAICCRRWGYDPNTGQRVCLEPC